MADVDPIVRADYSADTDGPWKTVGATDAVGCPTVSLAVYTVDTAPAGDEGDLAYFSDGNGGDPCLGVYTGAGIWARVILGAEIADS